MPEAPNTSNVVFDFDGTMVDSRNALKYAYVKALSKLGYDPKVPDDFFYKRWDSWTTAEVRSLKNHFYSGMIDLVPKLPAFYAQQYLGAMVITGASWYALNSFQYLQKFQIDSLACEVDLTQKIKLLQGHQASINEVVYYVDDDPSARSEVAREVEACIVLDPEEFLLSFLPRVRTGVYKVSSHPSSNRFLWSTDVRSSPTLLTMFETHGKSTK